MRVSTPAQIVLTAAPQPADQAVYNHACRNRSMLRGAPRQQLYRPESPHPMFLFHLRNSFAGVVRLDSPDGLQLRAGVLG